MITNSFLYYFTRPFARIALRVFFRKIHINNLEAVPWDKPLILAANHPAAFMEPCLLSVLCPSALHFLVRGDFFNKPLYDKLLRSYNMVPIYSKTDGYEKLKKNQTTLDFCYSLLSRNKTILIMAEGHTLHERRLRPIQKGTARLAFGALEQNEALDLYLVPVAVNYTYSAHFRAEVMFDFASPIRVQDYYGQYQSQKPIAIRQLTTEITNNLKARVIHVNHREDEELVEQMLLLQWNQVAKPIFPIHIKNDNQLKQDYKLVEAINNMPTNEKAQLKKEANGYFQELVNNKITDFGIAQSGKYNFFNTLMLINGFIPFLFGYVLNYLPVRAAKYVGDSKIKRREFYSSILVSVGLLNYFFYYLIWIVAAIIVNQTWLWVLVLLIPVLGYWGVLIYKELWEDWRRARAVSQLKEETVVRLRKKRELILKRVSD